MAKFRIVHREELVDDWIYEAESEEDAMEQYIDDVQNGMIDYNHMGLIKSSDMVVPCIDE